MIDDTELLEDFLTEAGELTVGLGPALMELTNPDADGQAINALFRTFHTLKGSAGFLGLDRIVSLCHVAEDLCSLLRSGHEASAEDIDALSAAIDIVEMQMQALQQGAEVPAAPASVLHNLKACVDRDRRADGGAESAASSAAGGLPDDDFEALLDAAHGVGTSAPTAQAGATADDDFDAILDAAHGLNDPAPAAETPAQQASAADDFDALLDAAHGLSEGRAAAPDPAVSGAASPGAEGEIAPANDRGAAPRPPSTEGPADGAAKSATPRAGAPMAETTIRVETKRLDTVMDLVGELVLARNALLAGMGHSGRNKAITILDRVTADLQSAVMRIRMQPLTKLFARFPRIVRDLARGMGKEIELIVEGADTELDKNVVEALSDPLVHLVRNAVDHGIESPDERLKHGKSARGKVRLTAKAQGDHVLIQLRDDGAGMDPNRLRSRAIERGLISGEQAATLDTQACLQLIFMAGFSTREVISDVSGRGVGMDVVKTKIDTLGGEVHLASEPGAGSMVELRLPLTLAILATLMVTVADRIFALPLSAVDEVLRIDPKDMSKLDGRPVLMVDQEPLPVFDLGLWVPGNLPYGQGGDQSHGVILRSGQQRYALVGARVCGREEVVIKPLDDALAAAMAFSGATVTGDGRIALVIDPAGLLKCGPLPRVLPTAAASDF
ncbi:MAG: chemotaxis protein CheA [Oceanococcaceae bacterium]